VADRQRWPETQTMIPAWRQHPPTTRDFGLVRKRIGDVVEEYVRWHAEEGIAYSRREISSSVADAFDSLHPLASNLTKRLFVSASDEWTCFFQNGKRGSDPFITMSRIARRLEVETMRLCVADQSDDWPAVMWELYDCRFESGRRTVAVANDGGRWTYHESGLPFEFEDRGASRRSLVRDRFTSDMLVRYLKEFGVFLDRDAFFEVSSARPAVLLERLVGIKRSE
jgi:hypothetical protein